MKTTDQVKRSNRLNKKLYVAEYAVYGFEISFQLSNVEEQVFDNFFSEMMAFVNSRNLIMGGAGGTDRFIIFISSYGRYLSATEQDREAFTQWLAGYNFLKDCRVEALSDAYYGE